MESRRDINRLMRQALERPAITLAVIAVVVAVLVYLFGWWALLLGILAAGLVLYTSPRALRDTRRALDSTLGQQSPADVDVGRLQGKYHQAMQRTLNTKRNIERAIQETQDPGTRRALADATRQLEELTQTIYGLALKGQSIHTALESSNTMKVLSDEIERLDSLIKTTNDEFQKSQYHAALDGKLQQMQNLTDTTVALSRWDAQMDNAISTMETILSQVLRIKSSEVLSYTGATDDLSQRLRQEIESLKATSDAMDEVYKT